MSQNLIIYIYLALSIPSTYCQDEQVISDAIPNIVYPVKEMEFPLETFPSERFEASNINTELLEDERIVREFLTSEHAQIPLLQQNNQYPEVQQPFSDYSIPFPAEPFIRKRDQQIETDTMVQTNSQDEHFEVSNDQRRNSETYSQVSDSELSINEKPIPIIVAPRKSDESQLLKTIPVARAAKLITVTSEQRIPARHHSHKGAAEIARIAGRLLFASLFNDLTHGATLVAPDERRVVPSPNPNRLIALPQRFSERDSKRGISRTSLPHTQQFSSNNASKRPRRPQYSIVQRQAAPRAVTPKRSHSFVSATRRITRPAPTSQPLLIPAPPPPPPQQIVQPEWNPIQAPFVDANFGQFSQANFLPAPVEKKARLSANEKLSLCCQKRQLSSNCQAMCNFDTFTQQSADHTECCSRSGLAEFNGGQCMVFCRTHEGKPSNALQYMGCLPVFKTIKECYREYQSNHPNIFGDFR